MTLPPVFLLFSRAVTWVVNLRYCLRLCLLVSAGYFFFYLPSGVDSSACFPPKIHAGMPFDYFQNSFPSPPPRHGSRTDRHSSAIFTYSPSTPMLSSSQLLPRPPSEQPPLSRIRSIAPRPPLTPSTSAPILHTPAVLTPIQTGSGNVSTTSHPLTGQPGLPPYSQTHCVAASSTFEPSEADHGGREMRRYPNEPVPSSLPARRPGSPALLPRSRRSRVECRNNSLHTVDHAFQLLRSDLQQRQLASDAFPPELSQAQIRASVIRYEEHIKAAAKQAVCSSCGRFVPVSEIVEVNDDDPLLRPLHGYLDQCGKHEDDWDVCLPCLRSLSQNTLPKFSALNRVNMTLCQNYPSVLEDLTPVEECLIAKCHPLGMIIKLRPGGHTSPLNYRALRGHFVVIPQDPEPLLEILPSPALSLHDMIRVFWLGKQPVTHTDLSPFLLVRKNRVLAALQYLVGHNQVYQDITINHQMIDTWSEEFIPHELLENIISVDLPDNHEREGYSVRLDSGNYENDLQAAQDTELDLNNNVPLITGSVSTDINGERQNPDRRLLNALLNAISDQSALSTQHTRGRDQQHIPTLSYTIQGQATLMDHWDDPMYFTAAFPTLFPFGIGGHLEDRPFTVSLASFAEWALKHHSRRYVRLNRSAYRF